MPGSATLYTQQYVLMHTLAIAAMPQPLGVFLALCTSAPTAINRGNEVGGGGYARQGAGWQLQAAPNNNIAANTASIEFPAATADWGNIGWFELWDTPGGAGGNRLYWGPLVDPTDGVTPITRNVLVGDIVRFLAGTIQVQAT